MARYKLLNKARLYDKFWVIGEIYDSTLRRNPKWRSVEEMARTNPNAWELVPEEKLPEKWCVCPQTDDNLALIKKWSGQFDNHRITNLYNAYTNDKKYYSTVDWAIRYGYSPITFNQFKRLVLKEESMKEKEIIGYILKEEYQKYGDAALKIMQVPWGSPIYHVSVKECINKLKQSGVLDLWFEPVYEESCPDITINGHKGEFFDNYVKFGCAEISHKYFCNIYNLIFKTPKGTETNREVESITIGKGTFTKEQIKEIASYYLNKK